MPYRKYYKKKSGYRKKYPSKSSLKKTIDKQIAKTIKPELKVHDLVGGPTPCSATGTFVLFNGVAHGTSGSTRAGNEMCMKSSFLRSVIKVHADSTVPHLVRVALIFIPVNSAALTQWVNLFAANSPLSPKSNLQDRIGKYVVLYDRTFALSPTTGAEVRNFKMFKKMNHKVHWTDVTGTIGDLGKGALYFGFITDAATNVPTIQYYNRLRFIDS